GEGGKFRKLVFEPPEVSKNFWGCLFIKRQGLWFWQVEEIPLVSAIAENGFSLAEPFHYDMNMSEYRKGYFAKVTKPGMGENKKMSMSVSVKKATGKTNINHNNRKFKEWEKEKNSHIDYERSKENKYFV